MILNKKRVFIISAIVVSILATAFLVILFLQPKDAELSQMIHCDYPYYPDAESITEAADVIIVGEVVSARDVKSLSVNAAADKENNEAIPYTTSTVRVKEVIKGNLSVGDEIQIKQLGDYKSMPEETLYEMDGYLEKDDTSLMFLCEYKSSPYSAVNPLQGIIDIKENGLLHSASKYSLWGYGGAETDGRFDNEFKRAGGYLRGRNFEYKSGDRLTFVHVAPAYSYV